MGRVILSNLVKLEHDHIFKLSNLRTNHEGQQKKRKKKVNFLFSTYLVQLRRKG